MQYLHDFLQSHVNIAFGIGVYSFSAEMQLSQPFSGTGLENPVGTCIVCGKKCYDNKELTP